jgi:hypothetical protein
MRVIDAFSSEALGTLGPMVSKHIVIGQAELTWDNVTISTDFRCFHET